MWGSAWKLWGQADMVFEFVVGCDLGKGSDFCGPQIPSLWVQGWYLYPCPSEKVAHRPADEDNDDSSQHPSEPSCVSDGVLWMFLSDYLL